MLGELNPHPSLAEISLQKCADDGDRPVDARQQIDVGHRPARTWPFAVGMPRPVASSSPLP